MEYYPGPLPNFLKVFLLAYDTSGMGMCVLRESSYRFI